MFVNENGSEKISLKVRDLKDALKEVNLHATMDELQSVLNKFNKGDSDEIHLYHLFSPKQMKKQHRQHSCNDLSMSKYSATS
jgi:hypothetical protein